MEKTVITLDPSNTVRSMNCMTDWYYHNFLGIAPGPKGDYKPTTPMMESGTYGHKLLERYYASPFIAGKYGKISLLDACDYAMNFDPNQETCVCGHHREYHKQIDRETYTNEVMHDSDQNLSINEIRELELPIRCVHCQINGNHEFKAIPVISPEGIKKVQERFKQYAYFYSANEDFRFNGPERLEVGFSKILFEDAQHLFIVEGRIDGLPTYRGLETFIDHKWQAAKKYLNTKSIQFRTYAWAAEVSMGYINYIRLGEEVNQFTFERVGLPSSRLDHQFWEKRLLQHFFKVAEFLEAVRSNDGIPPMGWENDANCMGQWGGMCGYRPLCDQAGQPLTQILIDSNYHSRQVWKPW